MCPVPRRRRSSTPKKLAALTSLGPRRCRCRPLWLSVSSPQRFVRIGERRSQRCRISVRWAQEPEVRIITVPREAWCTSCRTLFAVGAFVFAEVSMGGGSVSRYSTERTRPPKIHAIEVTWGAFLLKSGQWSYLLIDHHYEDVQCCAILYIRD